MRKLLVILAGWLAFQPIANSAPPEQVIEAEVERRDIKAPTIRSEDIEGGIYFGVLSVENFGSSSVTGARLAYHITEDFFLEGAYGKSEVSDSLIRKDLGQKILPNEHEELYYYNLSVGANLFPGELFLLGRWPVGTSVYLKTGVGTVHMVEDRRSFNFGFGLRLLPLDWMTIHIDMEDLIFEQDFLGGENKTTHNFQLHAGFTFFF